VLNLTAVQIHVIPALLWGAIVLIGIAGLAGGIIASTLPHEDSLKHFWETPTGPFGCPLLRGEYWTYVEHTAFWIGIVLAAGAFFFGQFVPALPSPSAPSPTPG